MNYDLCQNWCCSLAATWNTIKNLCKDCIQWTCAFEKGEKQTIILSGRLSNVKKHKILSNSQIIYLLFTYSHTIIKFIGFKYFGIEIILSMQVQPSLQSDFANLIDLIDVSAPKSIWCCNISFVVLQIHSFRHNLNIRVHIPSDHAAKSSALLTVGCCVFQHLTAIYYQV